MSRFFDLCRESGGSWRPLCRRRLHRPSRIATMNLWARTPVLLPSRGKTVARKWWSCDAAVTTDFGMRCIIHWSRVATVCDERSRTNDRKLRKKVQSHGTAWRTIADRWLTVLMAVLKAHLVFSLPRGKACVVERRLKALERTSKRSLFVWERARKGRSGPCGLTENEPAAESLSNPGPGHRGAARSHAQGRAW